MSIKLHVSLMFLCLGIVLFGVIAVFLLSLSWDYATYAVLGGVGLYVVIIWLFQHVIPAVCPRCGERAKLELAGTYKYRCLACEYVHETNISTNAD